MKSPLLTSTDDADVADLEECDPGEHGHLLRRHPDPGLDAHHLAPGRDPLLLGVDRGHHQVHARHVVRLGLRPVAAQLLEEVHHGADGARAQGDHVLVPGDEGVGQVLVKEERL